MTQSVAVVVLDAVRADAFAEAFDWLPGRHYETVYSTSHWTVPVHASLLTGLLPRETGTYAGSPSFAPPSRSLPARLRAADYTTRMYTANLQLVQWDGWTDDFDHVVGPQDYHVNFDWNDATADTAGWRQYPTALLRCLASDAPTIASLREGWRDFTTDDNRLTADRLKRLLTTESSDEPAFALINLMEVHSSAGTSTGEAIATGIDDPDALRTSYRAAVDDLALSYRDLYDTLADRFDWVITLSDHGDLLDQHGLSGHGHGLYPDLVRVPLVVSGPTTPERSPTDLVSLVDVPATVADIAGVDPNGRGVSLLSTSERTTAPVERFGQPHLHRGMFDRYGIADRLDEFDVPLRGVARADGSYAYETRDGTSSTDDWTGDPRPAIEEAFADVDRYTSDPDDSAVAGDVKDRLRDLGYA
ncbi:hypothetical protein BRD17_03315 [Halobacteriales archaeon SW_7_68_16]|nr:MAG: hypothetical protein BRD17_03315 [Halobacteriales archaeon SW_7_68_16]